MSFNNFNLNPQLLKNLQAMGFEHPTPIQKSAIPPALEGRDILGSAETGTGKTAAFLLPLLQKLNTTKSKRNPRALILTPTRELALQITEQAELLSKNLPLRTATVYGGVNINPQITALKRGLDVVIATPGRLLDHVSRKNISFSELEFFVLDEADRMLDIGFLPDIRRVVALLPTQRQTMLFSATLNGIDDLAYDVTENPVRVEVETTVTPDAITQVVFPVPEHLKFQVLQRLFETETMDSVLIFTRTKHRADRIARKLQKVKIGASVIHGNRSQGQRVAALKAFKQGKTRVLVATDIAARGIDVVGISHVINYDVPQQPEDYVHRIGRTGRAHAVGQAFTLVTPDNIRMISRIEYILGEKIPRRTIEGIDYNTPIAKRPSPEEIRKYVEANRLKKNAAKTQEAASPKKKKRPPRRRQRRPRSRNTAPKSN